MRGEFHELRKQLMLELPELAVQYLAPSGPPGVFQGPTSAAPVAPATGLWPELQPASAAPVAPLVLDVSQTMTASAVPDLAVQFDEITTLLHDVLNNIAAV